MIVHITCYVEHVALRRNAIESIALHDHKSPMDDNDQCYIASIYCIAVLRTFNTSIYWFIIYVPIENISTYEYETTFLTFCRKERNYFWNQHAFSSASLVTGYFIAMKSLKYDLIGSSDCSFSREDLIIFPSARPSTIRDTSVMLPISHLK